MGRCLAALGLTRLRVKDFVLVGNKPSSNRPSVRPSALAPLASVCLPAATPASSTRLDETLDWVREAFREALAG